MTELPRVEFGTVADPTVQLEFVQIDDLRRADGRGLEPHRSDFHQLIVGGRGELRHMVDFAWHSVTPGVALWVRPGQVQQFVEAEGTSALVLRFRETFPAPFSALAQLLSGIGAPTRYELAGSAVDFRLLLTAIRIEHDRPAPDEEILRHLLSILLMTLDRRSHHDPNRWTDGIFDRFVREVERHFSEQMSIDDYARRLGYSSKTIARSSGHRSGMSPKEIVDRRRLLEAKRLLAHTDATIAVVAARVGHPDQSNFAKFFTRREGLTPSAFRRQVRR